jgi:hypothetical protein
MINRIFFDLNKLIVKEIKDSICTQILQRFISVKEHFRAFYKYIAVKIKYFGIGTIPDRPIIGITDNSSAKQPIIGC